jgi:predicted acyl esterase
MSYHPNASKVHVPFTIPSGTPDRAGTVEVVAGLTARMRDGVTLGADVYVPGGIGPVPAIVIRQPYGRRTPDMGFGVVASFFAGLVGSAGSVWQARRRASARARLDGLV